MKCVGCDPGCGNFKMAEVRNGAVPVVVPSVVGVGQTDLGMLSIGDFATHRRRTKPDEVQFRGVSYLVGEGVARYARPDQRMDFERLSDCPSLRALFYSAIYRLLGAGEHEASLMIGLPVHVMADRQYSRSILRGLRKWLVASHNFVVNGDEVKLHVERVSAMAQPAGAFFAWGLDNSGHWVRDKNDLKVPVAVCDIGFNTLDLFTVEGGEVVARYTHGDTLGMRRGAEALSDSVFASCGVRLSPHEADEILRGGKASFPTADGDVDLGELVDQALSVATDGIVQFVERRWDNARQFRHVLFAGGGVENKAVRTALLRAYPFGVVLPNPVTANAVGLARYAARVFKPALVNGF